MTDEDEKFLLGIESLSSQAKQTIQPESLWDVFLHLTGMVRERDVEIARLQKLLSKCRDRLDAADESDDLWCAVNAILGDSK